MLPTRRGSFKLFEFAGISVYLHATWLLLVAFRVFERDSGYTSFVWAIWELILLFAIVLMHEFGHALACRSVGGRANEIVLWPFGGVAYVSPPQRPGPMLWSIVAGPLVNVVLFPIFYGALFLSKHYGLDDAAPNAYLLVRNICYINAGLFIFNCLPIYPLDGGKIFWALLWFICGRARSLLIATVIGIIGGVSVIALAIFGGSRIFGDSIDVSWICTLFVFAIMNTWRELRVALALLRLNKLPKHSCFACPSCKVAPPQIPIWQCSQCGTRFDTFQNFATCPGCGFQFSTTQCIECGENHPINQWMIAPPPPRPMNPPPIVSPPPPLV